MNRIHLSLVLALSLPIAVTACSAQGATRADKREAIHQLKDQAIADLVANEPELEEVLENAAGYGVFSNVSGQILFVGAGGGYGVVHDNESGSDTYMKMAQGNVGYGLGVKDIRAVFVFHDEETLRSFVDSGWDFGAQADAAAKSSDQGGAASAASSMPKGAGMDIYQLTSSGVMLQASLAGTKYWKDGDLNDQS